MTLKAFFIAATTGLVSATTVVADSATNKALVLEALEATLLSGNVDAVDQYFAKDYIQHNPDFANGVDGQKGVVAFLAGTDGFSAARPRSRILIRPKPTKPRCWSSSPSR